ncbi:MAG: phospholipase D-like domain-containing protein [Candidatus Thorarchaeota archaeon]
MKRSRLMPISFLVLFLSMLIFIQPAFPLIDLPSLPKTVSAQTEFVANTTTGTATVECYTSPDSSYNVTLNYLRQAQKEILMEMYAISNGFLLREFTDALGRNGTMNIQVIVSRKWASGSENHWTHASLYNISSLPGYGANVQAYFSRADLSFDHAKFIIIDREVVLVQSANWAKSGIPPRNSDGNREWGVAIRNPDVVNYFLNVFTADVMTATPYVQDGDDYDLLSSAVYTGPYPAPFTNQTYSGLMTITSLVSPNESIPAIVNLIDSATSTLDVQQMYSKMDWDGSPNQFNDAIIAAATRGVVCRVMLDNQSSGMQEVAEMFLANGVQVAFTNQTYFGWTHNKGVIADGQSVLISSINWSNESVSENREAGVIISHTGVANYFAQVFQWDWEVGEFLGQPVPVPTLSGPSQTTDGMVSLTWSITSGASDIDYYQLQVSNASDFSLILSQVDVTGTSRTVDLTSYGPGVYYFRVRAVNINGTQSAWSNVVSTTYQIPIPLEWIIIGTVAVIVVFVIIFFFNWFRKRR